MENITITILNVMGVLLLPVVSYAIYMHKEHYKMKEDNIKKDDVIEEYKLRNEVLDEVISITSASYITNAVNCIFDKTKSERFLLLFAINGKNHFNIVSVFFEQHKTGAFPVGAVARYRNVKIDKCYREMLIQAELEGSFLINAELMPESLLKNIYELEGVTHAQITHLLRHSMDKDNDVLLYSSCGTHKKAPFTKKELFYIKTKYDSVIIPNVIKLLKK